MGIGMTKEGEGMVLANGCPDHGTKYLYRKHMNGMWHEFCSINDCPYCDVVQRERKQDQPIQFEDRRNNGA